MFENLANSFVKFCFPATSEEYSLPAPARAALEELKTLIRDPQSKWTTHSGPFDYQGVDFTDASETSFKHLTRSGIEYEVGEVNGYDWVYEGQSTEYYAIGIQDGKEVLALRAPSRLAMKLYLQLTNRTDMA